MMTKRAHVRAAILLDPHKILIYKVNIRITTLYSHTKEKKEGNGKSQLVEASLNPSMRIMKHCKF